MHRAADACTQPRTHGCEVMTRKLTWLALGKAPATGACKVEQFAALWEAKRVHRAADAYTQPRTHGCEVTTRKLSWLALGKAPAACSCIAEQFAAL